MGKRSKKTHCWATRFYVECNSNQNIFFLEKSDSNFGSWFKQKRTQIFSCRFVSSSYKSTEPSVSKKKLRASYLAPKPSVFWEHHLEAHILFSSISSNSFFFSCNGKDNKVLMVVTIWKSGFVESNLLLAPFLHVLFSVLVTWFVPKNSNEHLCWPQKPSQMLLSTIWSLHCWFSFASAQLNSVPTLQHRNQKKSV